MHRQLVILISTNLQTCVFMNCKSFSCRDRFHCRWRNGNQVLAHRWPLCGLGELVCTESNTQPPSLYSFRNLPNVWDRSTRFANLSHPLLNCPSLSLSPSLRFIHSWAHGTYHVLHSSSPSASPKPPSTSIAISVSPQLRGHVSPVNPSSLPSCLVQAAGAGFGPAGSVPPNREMVCSNDLCNGIMYLYNGLFNSFFG